MKGFWFRVISFELVGREVGSVLIDGHKALFSLSIFANVLDLQVHTRITYFYCFGK